jgi:hypothetical protein
MFSKHLFILLAFVSFSVFSQRSNEEFPVFSSCENLQSTDLENCFYKEVQQFVFTSFKVPSNLNSDYKGTVIVIFEVTNMGNFVIQYVDSNQEGLQEETRRVFKMMPKVGPPTYNGKPTYARYTLNIAIPLQNPLDIQRNNSDSTDLVNSNNSKTSDKKAKVIGRELTELESIKYDTFQNPEYDSKLNIPFSHSYYSQFDSALNQVGSNNHTASKPYNYAEVSKYYNLKEVNQKLMKKKETWLGKKLWNENLIAIQGENYWFTLNPILDLQVGKASPSRTNYTFVNTRGIQFRGGLGKNLNFTTTIYESQGRFADYFNDYANSIKPDGGNPAIIPGIGIAKEFKTDAYDFPLAEANLTFAASDFLDIQLGYGRNFIGDGYRSLLLSDGASPYPFLKINTKFWKIKYTNTYTWLKDVRSEVTEDRTYATKFSANHYLSWNVTNKLNLGFFESVVWANQNNRGFDVNFVNPIIFYRAVEFSSSSRSGNALLGITSKYKINNSVNLYGQFLLDEFSLSEVKKQNQSWKNKFAFQIGAKYYDAFSIKNLLLQVEYNHIRPYVYAHSEVITNYGHNNQSLGHNWGGNAKEFLLIGRYHKGRFFADAKFTAGIRGLDFDATTDINNYGGNIYIDYDTNRPFDEGVKIGRGNKTKIFIADLQTGYLINPATNLKVFGSMIYRNFKPISETEFFKAGNTTWVSLGLRCDIFNWYFDY